MWTQIPNSAKILLIILVVFRESPLCIPLVSMHWLSCLVLKSMAGSHLIMREKVEDGVRCHPSKLLLPPKTDIFCPAKLSLLKYYSPFFKDRGRDRFFWNGRGCSFSPPLSLLAVRFIAWIPGNFQICCATLGGPKMVGMIWTVMIWEIQRGTKKSWEGKSCRWRMKDVDHDHYFCIISCLHWFSHDAKSVEEVNRI